MALANVDTISVGDLVSLFDSNQQGSSLSREQLLELYWQAHPRFRFFKSLPENASLLDIGAGNGQLHFWRDWMEPKRSDISLSAIDFKVGEYFDKYIEYQTGDIDGADFIFSDDSFDGILMSHVLEHIKSDKKILSELYRVLKPGGCAYLELPTPDSQRLPSRKELLGAGLQVSTINFFDDLTHLRTYSLKELLALIEGVGFTTENSGIVSNRFLEDQLFATGKALGDAELITYAIWLKTGWSQYIVAKKPLTRE